jgi:hypothetical protein
MPLAAPVTSATRAAPLLLSAMLLLQTSCLLPGLLLRHGGQAYLPL